MKNRAPGMVGDREESQSQKPFEEKIVRAQCSQHDLETGTSHKQSAEPGLKRLVVIVSENKVTDDAQAGGKYPRRQEERPFRSAEKFLSQDIEEPDENPVRPIIYKPKAVQKALNHAEIYGIVAQYKPLKEQES